MIDFMWSIQQAGRLAEAKTEAAQAKDEVSRQRARIEELEFHLDRMALASQALWEILRSRLEIPEEELLAKIGEIDLRDGVKDQRMTPQLISCPKCGRRMNTKTTRCIYCGTSVAKPNVFQ
jgi:hypothetical protein